jgi:predicted outer membrane repeat protein
MRIISRTSVCAGALLLAGTAALAAPAALASAAVQPPPNVPCSSSALVAAIQHANSVGSATLLLSPGCNYVLTTAVSADDGLPAVTGNLTITGSQGTTISRSSATLFRIFHVALGGSLTLSGVTLANGNTNNFGGGILDLGTLALRNVRVTGSTAAFGGGLFTGTNARATASFSEFTGNTAIDTGGAITAEGAALALWHVKLAGNDAGSAGGALFVGPGQNTISFSSLTGNTSQGFGGGAINNAGKLAIDHSTLTGNTARGTEGGGLRTAVGGTSQVSRTVVARNSAGTLGGGIANHGTTVLTGDRVVLNRATDGGGISNAPNGSVSLRFTLVAFNSPDNCTPQGTIRGCRH